MTDFVTLCTNVRDLSDAELKRQSYAAARRPVRYPTGTAAAECRACGTAHSLTRR